MSVEPRYAILTPAMNSALQAALRGPLDYVKDKGFVSRAGVDGCWNMHTIIYLAERRGFLSLNIGRTCASITAQGRAVYGAYA